MQVRWPQWQQNFLPGGDAPLPPRNSPEAFLVGLVIQKNPVLQALMPSQGLCGLYFYANGYHHTVNGTAYDSCVPSQPV